MAYQPLADLLAAIPVLCDAMSDACDYLECIPETAAGGDTEAALIAIAGRAALAKIRGEA
jgi:hypothetical protein